MIVFLFYRMWASYEPTSSRPLSAKDYRHTWAELCIYESTTCLEIEPSTSELSRRSSLGNGRNPVSCRNPALAYHRRLVDAEINLIETHRLIASAPNRFCDGAHHRRIDAYHNRRVSSYHNRRVPSYHNRVGGKH